MSILRICFVLLYGATCALPLSAQVISGFSPVLGAVGDQVKISGSGFSSGVVTVRFNNTIDPTAAATQDNLIWAQVPPGATTGRISVQIGTGNPVSSSATFTVIGPGPCITNFAPANGNIGTHVTIKGVHFTNLTAAYFNGKLGVNFAQTMESQVEVDVPSGATTGPIMVTGPSGASSTATNKFVASTNFYLPPVITSFSPSAGRTGTNVLLMGTNFLGAFSVTFNGLSCAFNVLSNRALQATVPTNATTGLILVDVPGASDDSGTNFVVQPTIFSFTPAFGAANTNVTLSGANLLGATAVYFNGAGVSPSTISFSQVTAKVPASATTGLISITTTNGTHTNPVPFYIRGSITSFTPSNAPPGTWIQITGQNLIGTTNVSFSGVPSTMIEVTNNTTLGALVPSGAVTGPITVSTPAGSFSSSGRFYGLPRLDSFSPTHGLTGTNVTIYGTNLLGTTAVRFNGLDATSFVATNNGMIRAVVPTNVQAGPITVIAPGGAAASSSSFTLDLSDLAVNVSSTAPPNFVGNNLTYSVDIVNGGLAAAPNARFAEYPPAGCTIVSVTSAKGTLVTNTSPITGSLGSLGAGETWSIDLTVRPAVAGYATNSVTVSSDFADPAPGNNTATNINYILPLPLLTIQLVTNYARLSWPLALSNYSLEARNGLASTNYWSNVLATVARTTNANVVTQLLSEPVRVYRLKQ